MRNSLSNVAFLLMLLSTLVFADIHPALKEAIDKKNYKQAENLVKNVGLKDVYCPSSLSAKDADKIYGKVFSDTIGYLLKNCDMQFSVTYLDYKCAGGKDKDMCMNLVSLTDPNFWPEKYPTQFCTKKNVEICAAALEKIPVEKSVPFLKAIKSNKLAEMKAYSTKEMRASGVTKAECKSDCEELKEAGIAAIRKQHSHYSSVWRNSQYENERYDAEMRVRDLERQEKEIRNMSCSKTCMGNLNEARFEKLKVHQYYFEEPFMALSQKVAHYYLKLDNPIIAGLSDYWSIVDDLFEKINNVALKSFESMTDTVAMLNALGEFYKKFERYPTHIAKKYVLNVLKSAFAKNEPIDSLEQLFYCKIYPSLDKETEKLFGSKIIDCKALLEENAKLFGPCEGDSSLFDGAVSCVDGSYTGRNYWTTPVGEIVVMTEVLFNQMPGEDVWCPATGVIDCMRHGPLYTWEAGQKACPDGWKLPNEKEMRSILSAMERRYEYSKDDPSYVTDHHLIPLPKNGYRNYEKRISSYRGKSVFMLSEPKDGKMLGGVLDSNYHPIYNEYGNGIYSERHFPTFSMKNTMLSVLCIASDVENRRCGNYYKDGACFQDYCCENGFFKKITEEKCSSVNGKTMFGDYVCENGSMRAATEPEKLSGKICDESIQGEFLSFYVCDKGTWREKTDGEKFTEKMCTEANEGEEVQNFSGMRKYKYKCHSGTWEKYSLSGNGHWNKW